MNLCHRDAKKKSRADIQQAHLKAALALIYTYQKMFEHCFGYLFVDAIRSKIPAFALPRRIPSPNESTSRIGIDLHACKAIYEHCLDFLLSPRSDDTSRRPCEQEKVQSRYPIFSPTIRICIYLHASRICIDLHACEAMFEHCLDFLLSTRSEDQSLRPRSQDRYWDLMI